MTTTINETQLVDAWKTILMEYQNVEVVNVSLRPNVSKRIEYNFSLYVTTKRGKKVIARIGVSSFKSQLHINFSDTKTNEMLYLLSELTDKIIENIEHLDTTFSLLSTFGQIAYPYSYRSKESRGKTNKRPSGVKKADILEKRDEILAFFRELKNKELPERTYHYDERRVFQVGGTGSKYLVELFLELGIATEKGKWDPYYTMRFDSNDYVSDLYSIMGEWEKFIRNEIGLKKCYVHSWLMD